MGNDLGAYPYVRKQAEFDPGVQTEYAPPVGEIEEQLLEIWQETLGVFKIGRNDSFFELGGHSLLSIRLLSGIRERFEVELPLRVVFESPTIAEIAKVIESELRLVNESKASADVT
jgi:acyl carrier protein